MQRSGAARPAAASAAAAAAAEPVAAEPSPPPPPPPPPWPGIRAAFALTYAAFAVCYVVRATASASKKALASRLSLSDGALGGLDALFLGAYTAGNFTLGVRRARDSVPPRRCAEQGTTLTRDVTRAFHPRSVWRMRTRRGACWPPCCC
jgi:hypothetical protein